MRAALRFHKGKSKTQYGILAAEECKNIPEAIDKLLEMAKKHKIPLAQSFTLVFPLDDRHNLAWIVKEEADRRGWKFDREAPRQ